MEIFLRHLEQKGLGYRWRLPFAPENLPNDPRGPSTSCLDGDTLIIPGSAYCDDLILLCTSATDAQTVLQELELFLVSCGMSLNASKCHYITSETDLPALQTTLLATQEDASECKDGTISKVAPYFRLLPHRPPSTPFRYLGQMNILEPSTDATHASAAQNANVRKKFSSGLYKIRNPYPPSACPAHCQI